MLSYLSVLVVVGELFLRCDVTPRLRARGSRAQVIPRPGSAPACPCLPGPRKRGLSP